MTQPTTPPAWTANEKNSRKRVIKHLARLLYLHHLQQSGTLDLSNKSALARSLGVHRHQVDRDLFILAEATAINSVAKLAKN